MKIKNVEQRSREWFEMRLGVITGSRCANVFKSNNLAFADLLIAERLSGEVIESPTTEAMRHGIMMEPVALDEYRLRIGQEVREVGFCIHDDHPFLAISPDALVYKDGKPIGGVEIKCPSTKNHVSYIRGGRVPAIYKPQVMHYFVVIDSLEWVDFVSFDPRMSPSLFIFRVHRNDPEVQKDIEARKSEYLKFWQKVQKYEQQVREGDN
jgi:putative phage-type endonuclease